jgi:hypothetical protein
MTTAEHGSALAVTAATVTSADVAALVKAQKPDVAVVDVRDQQVRQDKWWNAPDPQKERSSLQNYSCTVNRQLLENLQIRLTECVLT